MENRKINIKTIIIFLLIVVIISLVFIILNMKNINIAQQEVIKEQLGETTGDNTYVGMQSHLSEVNEQEEKLVSFKSAIATAITDKGVVTSTEADATTMANNIKSISGSSTFTGTFDSRNGATVNLGFKPSYVAIISTKSSARDMFIYNADWSTTIGSQARINTSTGNSGYANIDVGSTYFQLTDTGFYYKAFNNNGSTDALYFACK